MALLDTLTTIRYYTPFDPYFCTVDNRPLQDLEARDIEIAEAVQTLIGGGSGSYLPITGGTMTGPLLLSENATQNMEAVTYQQFLAGGGGGGAGGVLNSYTYTSTAGGETVIHFPWNYLTNAQSLVITLNGLVNYPGTNYTETSVSSITMTSPLAIGDSIRALSMGASTVINTTPIPSQSYTLTSTGGETVITLPWSYPMNGNSLLVSINGILQSPTKGYNETTTSSITLTGALISGEVLRVVLPQGNGSGVLNSYNLSSSGGETLITLPWSYTTDGKSLQVFVNGLLQSSLYDYTETSGNSLTLGVPLVSGDHLRVLSVAAVSTIDVSVPIATVSVVGGVKVGSGLSVGGDGTLSVSGVGSAIFGTTWTSYSSGSRTHDVSYHNTSSEYLMVAITLTGGGAINPLLQVSSNNSTWITVGVAQPASAYGCLTTIVPPGYYYQVNNGSSSLGTYTWAELS